MKVSRLHIRNFRSYEDADLILSPGMNVFLGQNAQGKTNLLESLVYLSLSKSHRVNDDRLLIRRGQEYADLECTVQDGCDKTLRAVIHSRGKTLFLNRQVLKRSSDFIGQLNVVFFAPDDLSIFADAPRERRRIMDQEIGKIQASYVHCLNRFHSLLKDRNAALKAMTPDSQYLDVLDEQMASEEEQIISFRRAFIDLINANIASLYQELSGDNDQASVRYLCCSEKTDRNSLQQMHQSSRQKDIFLKATSFGIHREDLVFELNGVNVIEAASQGQKRMMMLAFKMSILRYIEAASTEKAVLLLDDVLSELDSTHQRKLMNMISASCQSVITTTALPPFMNENHPKLFFVEHGTVKEMSGGAG